MGGWVLNPSWRRSQSQPPSWPFLTLTVGEALFYSEGGRGFVKTLEWKDFIRKLYQRVLFGAGLKTWPCPA